MFTGIIDHCGRVVEIIPTQEGLRIIFDCKFTDLTEGESIAIDGACFTALQPQKNRFAVDVSPETLNITTAGKWQIGAEVNLERSLRLSDRLGGHIVMGHVDQVARVMDKKNQGEFVELSIADIEKSAARYLIKKGSVALNGVSLTINEIIHNGFQLMIIPHTLQRTNLQHLQIGDQVNIEFDWLLKTIVAQCQQRMELL